MTQKREQIKTAYTITRAGRQGMGVVRPAASTLSKGQLCKKNASSGPCKSLHEDASAKGSANESDAEPEELSGAVHGRAARQQQSSSTVVARLTAGTAPCKRFLERGNKPIPAVLDAKDGNPENARGAPKEAEMAVVPVGQPDQKPESQPPELDRESRAKAQNDRQVVYGNLKLGRFEDEISGINLSKLFSVYGPQSAEGKRRKRTKKGSVGDRIGNRINSDLPEWRLQKGLSGIRMKQIAPPNQNPHVIPSMSDIHAHARQPKKGVPALGIAGGENREPGAGQQTADRQMDSLLEGQPATSPVEGKSQSNTSHLNRGKVGS